MCSNVCSHATDFEVDSLKAKKKKKSRYRESEVLFFIQAKESHSLNIKGYNIAKKVSLRRYNCFKSVFILECPIS